MVKVNQFNKTWILPEENEGEKETVENDPQGETLWLGLSPTSHPIGVRASH